MIPLNYRYGLIVSIIIGTAIALFPLYGDKLSNYLLTWSAYDHDVSCEETGSLYTLRGIVENIDIAQSKININGIEIRVVGLWLAPNGTYIEAQQLLAMIKPGEKVRATYSKKGKWGFMLEEIVIEDTGERYVRLSSG